MDLTSNKFSNKEIAYLLRSVATAYIIKDENNFKIIAYEKAADSIDKLGQELKDIWEKGKLQQVAGIGKSLTEHLNEYFTQGQVRHFNHVFSGIPPTVFELVKISSIGPKKAFKLAKYLKLNNVKTIYDDLLSACLNGKIAKLDNFGEKSQEEILNAVKLYQKSAIYPERMPLPYAYSLAQQIISYLKKNPQVERIDILGSLRRMAGTIGDVDIAIQIKNPLFRREIINYFINYPKKITILNAGESKASILVTGNRQIDLRIQEKRDYGSMLQYFTGSKNHNIKLREYAQKLGYSLSEYGIKQIKNQKPPLRPDWRRDYEGQAKIKQFSNEENIYQFLKLQHIPPEIREGTNEIEIAQKHQLPNLVELKDIKGDLHLHSSYNLQPSHDLGENSYSEIALKAKSFDYHYIGFSDHNPKISNQSDDDIVNILKIRKRYIDKIFSINKNRYLNYFIGIESDISPNGQIAIPIGAIKYLDYIIAAIHSSFNLDHKLMTQRIIKALKFPKVKILAHPTGRRIGKREGIDLDWDKIFQTCASLNVAIEINAWPERLDLPDILVKEALRYNIKFVINTDAHNNNQMENMLYGVAVARRGWCEKNDIINSKSYEEVKKWMFG